MGCAPSKDQIVRGQLLAPLGGCCGGDASQVPPAQRIVGTYVLDTALNQDCCCAESPSSAIPCACAAPRNQFVVPYPCHCCGADCCCCPNSPAGPEWAAAMAGGFGQLLDELARAVLATAATHEDGVSRLALLGRARQASAAPWAARANAFLARYGLCCAVFNFIQEKRDDKGNKYGEMLLCAVQVYGGTQLPAIVAPRAAGAVEGLAGPQQAYGSGGGGGAGMVVLVAPQGYGQPYAQQPYAQQPYAQQLYTQQQYQPQQYQPQAATMSGAPKQALPMGYERS